jgi:hypothetical protein
MQPLVAGCCIFDPAADRQGGEHDGRVCLGRVARRVVDRPGQFFGVRAERYPDYVWVEAEDLGGPWCRRQRDGRPHGLDLVEALTGPEGWGVETTTGGGRVVWARLDLA